MIPENDNNEMAVIKNQLFILLVALIVVSGTLTVYLYRQVSLANKDIAMSQMELANITTNEMAIGSFVERLVSFGERHPEFLPVLKKEGINPQALPAMGTPTAPKK